MYLERSPKPQTGAGLPLAIFIVTVLSLIVLGMSQLQQSSGKAISLQIQSQRAFFAAESGIQISLQRVFEDIDSVGVAGASCPPDISDFGVSGLSGCSVILRCTSESGDVFVLASQGSCGTGIDRAERVIEVRVQ